MHAHIDESGLGCKAPVSVGQPVGARFRHAPQGILRRPQERQRLRGIRDIPKCAGPQDTQSAADDGVKSALPDHHSRDRLVRGNLPTNLLQIDLIREGFPQRFLFLLGRVQPCHQHDENPSG